jgi:hypothetical protein
MADVGTWKGGADTTHVFAFDTGMNGATVVGIMKLLARCRQPVRIASTRTERELEDYCFDMGYPEGERLAERMIKIDKLGVNMAGSGEGKTLFVYEIPAEKVKVKVKAKAKAKAGKGSDKGKGKAGKGTAGKGGPSCNLRKRKKCQVQKQHKRKRATPGGRQARGRGRANGRRAGSTRRRGYHAATKRSADEDSRIHRVHAREEALELQAVKRAVAAAEAAATVNDDAQMSPAWCSHSLCAGASAAGAAGAGAASLAHRPTGLLKPDGGVLLQARSTV